MSNLEYADYSEHKYTPTEAEFRQNKTATNCAKALAGQLSYTTKEWLKKEDYIQ